MILVLSKTLAKRWKFDPVSMARAIKEDSFHHPALVWRIDWFQIGQSKSNILCTNDSTTFSFVLLDQKQMPMKRTILNIINRIADILHEFGLPETIVKEAISQVIIGYDPNKSAIGIMTDQKIRYEWAIIDPPESVKTIDDVERRINHTPCGARGMKFPIELFSAIMNTGWPTSGFAFTAGSR